MKKGFTLIELLIVITIVGVITTLTFVALNAVRGKSRDSKRVADIRQWQAALEMYKNDNNVYPSAATSGQPLVGITNGYTYMKKVPSAPGTNDGTCTGTDAYTYSSTDPNTTYNISYCLGNAVQNAGPSNCSAVPGQICLAGSSGGGSGGAWSQAGDANFSLGAANSGYIDLAIYNSTPYIAYYDGGYTKVVAAYLSGSTWTIFGGGPVSSSNSSNPAIGINNSGTVYVAYSNSANGDKGNVVYWNGSAWTAVGGANFSSGGLYTYDIIFVSNVPYICSLDTYFVPSILVKYLIANTWQNKVNELGDLEINCEIDQTGNVFQSHYDGSSGAYTVHKYDGVSNNYLNDFTAAVFQRSSWPLAIHLDEPYIFYKGRQTDTNLHVIKYSSGVKSELPSVESSDTFYAGAITSDGTSLYVAYHDGSYNVYVKKYNGSSWEALGTQPALTNANTNYTIKAVSGTVYLAYSDRNNGDKVNVKKFTP